MQRPFALLVSRRAGLLPSDNKTGLNAVQRCMALKPNPSSGISPAANTELETAMDRAQKAESIESLKSVFADAGAVVVTHNLGLTVAEMEDLRGRLRKEGGAFKVVKNRLALKALGVEEGSAYHDLFKGPVGIAYASDPVTAAKVAAEFAKGNDKFKLIGGFMGDKVLDAAGVDALSKLPSLDQLRGKLIGLLQAPATKVAGVLQAPAGQLARVFNAYATKDAA
ncbi:large subunit ribosomal protein L10 [Brevundimonas faecalis]|uniref:Large ribosomal subunit protein uL10 n=2 Tax=Brevundimonas faecalis TaxID=947378 RepID=A0ABV2R9D6_9CAUL